MTDAGLANALAATYRRVRRSRYRLLDPALPLLAELRERPALKLGLVTNGPSDLQHEKIVRTGLDKYVDVVVVSGDLGAGKPDPAVFDHALARLGVEPRSAIMVGDSLERDVAGAAAAGLASLWIGDADALPDGTMPTLVAADLAAAADLLRRVATAGCVSWVGFGHGKDHHAGPVPAAGLSRASSARAIPRTAGTALAYLSPSWSSSGSACSEGGARTGGTPAAVRSPASRPLPLQPLAPPPVSAPVHEDHARDQAQFRR